MATHDYSIANQSFPATRSDINNALAAIQSSNSAATAPSGTGSTVAGELFYNTTANKLQIATDANGTFVDVALDSSGNQTVTGTLGVTGAATFTAEATFNGGIALGDSDYATFGAGDDLQIYHDGTNSYISESGTGALVVQSNGSAIVLEKTDGENMILAAPDGAVTLYYDGNERLATTANGITITTSGLDNNVIITNTEGDDNIAPDLILYRNSSTPADNDNLGSLEFRGKNSAGNDEAYARISGLVTDVTDTTEDAHIRFYTMHAGVLTDNFRMENDGDFHADGDVIAYSTTTASDEKLKTGIHTVTDAIAKIYQLDGVEFTWKKDGTRSAGVIAQNVEQVMPEAVKDVEGLGDKEGHKAVNYNALHSLYIEAIKELKDLVDEQAQEIELLKKG